MSQGDQRRRAEVGHVLALDVHHLVPGLEASQVGTAALHHRQDVAGPGATQSEAKRLGPVLVGGGEAEICRMGGGRGFWWSFELRAVTLLKDMYVTAACRD